MKVPTFHIRLIFSLFFLLLIGGLMAQEVCDNGVDDDGDGLIDLNDDECDCVITVPLIIWDDFEDQLCCPTISGEIECLENWFEPSEGTADYFHECGYNSISWVGSPPSPLPSGLGCVGFASVDFVYGEYVATCPDSDFIAGETYNVEFYLGFSSMPDVSRSPYEVGIFGRVGCPTTVLFPWACLSEGAPGVWEEITTISVSGTPGTWTMVTSSFIANSDYGAIAIGPACIETYIPPMAYFFLDDVLITGLGTQNFPKPFIESSGDCITGVTISTSYPNATGYQWYYDGIAILGAQSSNLTVNFGEEGLYQVMVFVNGGCTISDEFEVIIDPEILDITADIEQVTCFFYNNGSIVVDVSNSNNDPLIYQWDHGPTTQNITNLDIGTYEVTITDDNGCFGSSSFDITQPNPLLGAIINIQNPSTPTSFGSAEGDITGGTPLYTYFWDNGETTKIAVELTPGLHTLQIVDANGCEFFLEVIIEGVMTVSADVNNNFCAGQCGGSLDVYPLGGMPPYTYEWSDGSTDSYNINLCQGTYTCTITDDSGLSTEITEEITGYPPIQIDINYDLIVCDSNATTDIDLSIVTGSSPYIYNWSNDSTSQDLINVKAGMYNVTITDGNSCVHSDTVLILENLPISYQSQIVNAECNMNNGSIDITDIQGTGPFTFEWNTGDSIASISNKDVGAYMVTITDTIGCYVLDTFAIDNTQSASITSDFMHPICPSDSNGQIYVTIDGGNLPLTYNWSNGSTDSMIVDLPQGDYLVTITDGIGCSFLKEVSLSAQSILDLEQIVVPELCSGDDNATISANAIDGIFPLQYDWDIGPNTPLIENLSPGRYELIITDSLGCTYNFIYNLGEGNQIAVSDELEINQCFGQEIGSISLTTIGEGPFTYEWENIVGADTVLNLENGQYQVTISDVDGCSTIQTFEINSPPELITSFDVTQPGCTGDTLGSIQLNTEGGVSPYEYMWSNSSTLNSLDQLAPGDYYVTITDDNECTMVDSVNIETGVPLEFTSVVDSILCYEDLGSISLIPLTGNPPYQYLWEDNSDLSIRNNLSAGNYDVEITDSLGCMEALSFTLNDIPLFEGQFIDISPPNVDNEGGYIEIEIEGGIPPYKIFWSNGVTDMTKITDLPFGTYSYIIEDANGCTSSGEIEFLPEPLLIDNVPTNNLCFDSCTGSIDIEVLGGVRPYTFQWSDGSTIQNRNDLCTDIYNLIVIDAFGETLASNSINISSPSQLEADITSTGISCFDKSDGILDLSASGGQPGYTYYLDNVEVNSFVDQLSAGQYLSQIIDDNDCIINSVVTIDTLETLIIEVSASNIDCNNPSGTIVLTSNNPLAYGLTLNDDIVSNENTSIIEGLQVGQYTIGYAISNDCKINTSTVDIIDENDFTFQVSPTEHSVEQGAQFEIQIDLNGSYDFIEEIIWESGLHSFDCTEFDQEHCITLSSTAVEDDIITLTIITTNGCLHDFAIPITVNSTIDIQFPNIFSPNGDGINETFGFNPNDPIQLIQSFIVYDRWGNVMYQVRDVGLQDFIPWDGKFNGQNVDSGVYLYTFEVKLLNGDIYRKTGDITVFR